MGEQAIFDDESATVATLKDNATVVNLKFNGENTFENPVETNLYEIFSYIAQEAVVEIGVSRFLTYLSFVLRNKAYKDAVLDTKFPMPVNYAKSILGNFQALGLFEPSSKRHKVGDPEEYWQITEKGKRLHLALIRKALERRALVAREASASVSSEDDGILEVNSDGSEG